MSRMGEVSVAEKVAIVGTITPQSMAVMPSIIVYMDSYIADEDNIVAKSKAKTYYRKRRS